MLKIVKDTNPQLKEKSVEVELPPSEENIKIVKQMLDYIKKSQDEKYAEKHGIRAGVGLAAPQIGINKKMLGTEIKTFYCMECLADYLGCSVEDLLEKIEEFKDEGCTLFK